MMITMTPFEEWLTRVTNGASHRMIAAEIGVQNTALSRWIRENRLPAERIIDIARAYKTPVFDGLRAAGYLTADDFVGTGEPSSTFADRTTRELVVEVLRRVAEQEAQAEAEERRVKTAVEQILIERGITP